MPFPLGPNDFKDLVPSTSGNFCEKFVKSLKLADFVYRIVNYIWKENGEFTDDFKADICALSCIGSGGDGTVGQLQAPVVSATDGAFSDKVQVTWTVPVNAATFDLYRHTVDDKNAATKIGSDLTVTVYDDSSVSAGTYYYYWVKAKNASQTSAFSATERGHSGSIATELPQITALDATRGWTATGANVVALVFPPVTGAETYDFYRSLSDDFTSAVLIDSGRTPFNNELTALAGPSPSFVDNVGELTYIDTPPNALLSYYYWVIAKRAGPPAQSPPSNSARGWGAGFGDGGQFNNAGTTIEGSNVVVASGYSRIHFALFGAGAAGAGGDASVGGGGGGAACVISGDYIMPGVIANVSRLRVRGNPTGDTASTASATNGANGPQTLLEYSAAGDWSDTVVVAVCDAPSGGVFNPAGGGVGGAGASGSVDGDVLNSFIKPGRAGKAASANKGGRGGNRFGGFLKQAAHFNGFGPASFAGDGGIGTATGGGGSYAYSATPASAQGGRGQRGAAVIGFRA